MGLQVCVIPRAETQLQRRKLGFSYQEPLSSWALGPLGCMVWGVLEKLRAEP